MSSTMFTGASRYSQDFQSIIDRSVAIASLPLSLLQDQHTTLQNDSAALSSIDSKFTALQSAVTGINTALGSASYDAVTSTDAASATISDGVREGTYKIAVTSFGSYAVASSVDDGTLQNVSNPATQNLTPYTSYELKVGGRDPITLSASNLNALVDAINSSAVGGDLSATLVNVGSADGSDRYALSVQGKRFEPLAITLTAKPVVIDAEHQPVAVLAQPPSDLGANVKYKVGSAAEAVSTSRSFELSPGLSVTLLDADAGTFDVNVTRDSASVRSALQSFAAAYNSVVDELDKHHGTNGGALAGQGIVTTLAEPLRAMTSWSAGPGSLKSLRDIGLVMDSSGKLSLDTVAFSKATKNGIGDVAAFLGSATTSGFLKTAAGQLDSVEKTGTGILESAISINNDAIKASTDHINAEQKRIDDLKTSLQEQMAKADALIASLEQQATYIGSMFESMRVASETYK